MRRSLGSVRVRLSAAALLGTLLIGCSAESGLGDGDTGPLRSADAGHDASKDVGPPRTLPPPPCPPSNPFCDDEPSPAAPSVKCESESIDLRPAAVNVMIAVDGSKSMESLWPQLREAVLTMVSGPQTARFGIDLFWADVVESVEEGFARINACGDTQHKFIELGTEVGPQLPTLFGDAPPGPGVFFYDFTPVTDPLNYYLVNETELSDPTTTNYLVLISDGNDNCYGNFWAGEDEKRLAYEKLTRELVKKNIRVLPIGFNGSSGLLDLNGEPITTDFAALDTIAQHGGTGITEALAADDADQLQQAIATVSQRVASCRFQIPAALDPVQNINPFALEFLLNGKIVERDRGGQDGWNFVAGNVSEVEFFGAACQAVRAGVSVEAKKTCNEAEVCGNAATRVSAKPRAVQYLLDRSLSMAQCTAGFLGCVPGLTLGKTWWGVAANAIASSVGAPINDDVEFGLKYFPDQDAVGGCEVSDQPDVAPEQGTAISLIGHMLHTLPTGATPLLAGLEKVAQNPGRLVDPEVSGALIVMSDGGEACEEIDQATKVRRLAAAAKSLHDRGVQVFAVRFGAQGEDFAEQDAQLRAIVREGGTAIGDPDDPKNVPYLEAPDAETLNSTLASISEELASCALELGTLDPEADKSQVNLYLDGEVVPFDQANTEASGWSWSDDARTQIELHGESCQQYKSSRSTSIIIEVGCTPIVVF